MHLLQYETSPSPFSPARHKRSLLPPAPCYPPMHRHVIVTLVMQPDSCCSALHCCSGQMQPPKRGGLKNAPFSYALFAYAQGPRLFATVFVLCLRVPWGGGVGGAVSAGRLQCVCVCVCWRGAGGWRADSESERKRKRRRRARWSEKEG